jgi:hypothetical protein
MFSEAGWQCGEPGDLTALHGHPMTQPRRRDEPLPLRSTPLGKTGPSVFPVGARYLAQHMKALDSER